MSDFVAAFGILVFIFLCIASCDEAFKEEIEEQALKTSQNAYISTIVNNYYENRK